MSKDIASKFDEDNIAHSTVHTKNYYLAVWKRLEKTNDPISVRHSLEQIAKELSDGSFPY